MYNEWLKSNKIDFKNGQALKLTKHPQFSRNQILEIIYELLENNNDLE